MGPAMWNLANSTNLIAEKEGSDDNSLEAVMNQNSISESAPIPGGAESPSSPLNQLDQRSPPIRKADLPPLFWYMEAGEWEKASERIRKNPREIKTWATLRTKSALDTPTGQASSTTKRLALHHACFKLRGAGATSPRNKDDPFVEVCRLISLLITLYPEAAQKRESRHGCLPLHLAAFASCAPREPEDESESSYTLETTMMRMSPTSTEPLARPNTLTKRSASASSSFKTEPLRRPAMMSDRCSSDATNDTIQTNMSAVHAEENYTGAMSDAKLKPRTKDDPNVSVSMRPNTEFSAKREEMLVKIINELLDAYPKASRVDSEGGRLPLHTACAGRATPRVVSTLITAYPAAARQRNKDGFLPLHLAAHWGVSHIEVAFLLLKTYPDATVGRNRWERTPLEEALCMAGENGRPHQAALVRALRKHPSWWTRPYADIMAGSRRAGTVGRQVSAKASASTAVDVDESLPSNEESTQEDIGQMIHKHHEEDFFEPVDEGEEVQLLEPNPSAPSSLMQRLSPRVLLGKTKRGVSSGSAGVPDPLGVGVSLAHLIEQRQWRSVVARVRLDPLEAEQELQVMTRGGFMASIGMSPLHYVCERKPPLQVVQQLVECFPFALLTRAMPGGCLPLHIACTWGCSLEVIKVLLAVDSGSVRVKDELGNVALHSACFAGADSRIVEALLQADSKSVLARNHQGSRPIDICKRLRHENRRTVMDLLTAKKEAIMRSHRAGSSGALSEIARQAEDLNRRNGTPALPNHGPQRSTGGPQALSTSTEVAIDKKDTQADTEPLVWI